MGDRDDAVEILAKLSSCAPRPFFAKMEESQRGVGFVLVYLDQAEGDVLAGDLAREAGVSTARIAALLRSMEKNGLITRRKGTVDARQTVVKITPAGNELIRERKEQLIRKIERMIEKVGKEDIEEFIRISQKIQSAMGE